MERKSFKDGVQFAFDSTSVTLAMECPRKYYYRMIRNITPLNVSVHLIFGGIFASALELFYKERAAGASIPDATLAAVKSAMCNSWVPATETSAGHPVLFEDDKKTRVTLIRTIVWYLEEYGDESAAAITTHILPSGQAAAELSFALELSDDILYCGHLDRVVDFHGDRFWMDQKTTGSALTSFFWGNFKMSNQFLGYTWAGSIILESPVKGGLIDGVQVASGFSRFERQPIFFSAEQLREWKDNTLYHIAAIRSLTALNKFPMNLTSCGHYNGCEYKRICQAHPAIRESIIQSDFQEPASAWDPLTPR